VLKRIKYSFLIFLGLIFSIQVNASNNTDFFGVKTVVIDAGHGGKDGGCQGASSQEKNVALAIALKLGKHIEDNFPDVKVIYTRKTDVFIELNERAMIANRAKADLFICVHANANDNHEASGTETFVMGLHVSNANLRVAQRENSSILMEDNYKTTYENFDPNSPESYIIFSMRQNAFLNQSTILASKIQNQFSKRVGRKDRGVKQAGFLVLYKTAMPSVLIETGFLTNKEEEKFLDSEQGQDYLASAIYRAFKEYKKELEQKIKKDQLEKESLTPQKKEMVKDLSVDKKDVEKGNKKEKRNQKKKKEDVVELGVIFKVQIATSSEKKELKSANFNGVENVSVYQAGGIFRYTVGNEKNIGDANILQIKLKGKGFEDAFIVAFKDGKRIPLSEAITP